MTIRGVLKNGVIHPLEPLPPGWAEGQEFVIEEPTENEEESDLAKWAAEMHAGAAAIPAEEHERFRRALVEIEKESKEAVRREWGL